MKHNKLLAVLSLAAVIGLTSCGGNKPTSSAKPSTPTSTVKPSTSKPSVSVAPVPAATVGEINVDKTGDKVELVITGEVENIKAEDFKMAVSLLKRDTAEGEDPVYLIGGATFADADYKYTGTIANGAYTVKVNLSDVVATDGTSAAEYDIAVAVKGVGDLEVGAESNLASKKDGNYTYLIRNDQGNVDRLFINALPLISLDDATLTTTEDNKVILRFGGDASSTLTEEQEIYFNMQRLGNYGMSQPTATIEMGEGGKAYVVVDITSIITAGNTYSTHCQFKALESGKQPYQADNCIMNVAFEKTYVVQAGETKLKVTVVSRPGTSGEENYHGTLGFAVEEAGEEDVLGLVPAAQA